MESDTKIDSPTFVPKVAIFLQIWVKVCLKKLAFLLFEPILGAGLLDKMLALTDQRSTLFLFSGFIGCCIFTNDMLKSYLKGRVLTKKAPQTTIITIFITAKLH